MEKRERGGGGEIIEPSLHSCKKIHHSINWEICKTGKGFTEVINYREWVTPVGITVMVLHLKSQLFIGDCPPPPACPLA